jgi:hypothetical protein
MKSCVFFFLNYVIPHFIIFDDSILISVTKEFTRIIKLQGLCPLKARFSCLYGRNSYVSKQPLSIYIRECNHSWHFTALMLKPRSIFVCPRSIQVTFHAPARPHPVARPRLVVNGPEVRSCAWPATCGIILSGPAIQTFADTKM